MAKHEPHVLIALVGERIEKEESIEVGTIVMAEYPTEQEADQERDRRNALVRQGHPAHRGREYITMSVSEYASMTGDEEETTHEHA